MISVFDKEQLLRQRLRSENSISPSKYFLFDWVMEQISDRLSIIKKDFSSIVQIGERGKKIDHTGKEFLLLDATLSTPQKIDHNELLPLNPESADLIVSALQLHTINDLPGFLLQIKKSLKPDGLFLCGMLGGETLHELRGCLMQAEIEMTGGATPRVFPFADKQQMGGLLQRAGFSLPVVDSDILTVTYNSIFDLMKDLRDMGEGNAITQRKKTFTPKSLFVRAGEIYAQKYADSDGRIKATFEIIFLFGWSPHQSQQKPLSPGSAQTRLSDFLQTTEIGTGEKPN